MADDKATMRTAGIILLILVFGLIFTSIAIGREALPGPIGGMVALGIIAGLCFVGAWLIVESLEGGEESEY